MSLCFRLDSYFFLEMSVKANSSYDFKNDDSKVKLEKEYSLKINDEDPKLALAEFTLSSISEKSVNLPYEFKVSLIAFISSSNGDEFNGDDEKTPVDVAQILYGIARESIVSMTSRGPFPPFFIPAIRIGATKKNDD